MNSNPSFETSLTKSRAMGFNHRSRLVNGKKGCDQDDGAWRSAFVYTHVRLENPLVPCVKLYAHAFTTLRSQTPTPCTDTFPGIHMAERVCFCFCNVYYDRNPGNIYSHGSTSHNAYCGYMYIHQQISFRLQDHIMLTLLNETHECHDLSCANTNRLSAPATVL